MRILLFGDGVWATNSLQRLAQEGWTLLGIVVRTKPTDLDLLATAEELHLPIFQPQRVNDSEFVTGVGALQPDLNLSVSYDQILRSPILETAPLGFVNFHAGKLPHYRGRNAINWAIINDETEIGLTAHYINEGIDTGDIILQRTLPIAWTDTYGDVLHNIVAVFPDFVAEVVRLIERNEVNRQPQAYLEGTYFSARILGDEWIDWHDTSLNIYNKIRAITHPGPGARTTLGDRTLVIWRARYDPNWPKYIATPGEVIGTVPGQGAKVKTGDSTLILESVQFEGEDELEQVPIFRIGIRFGIDLIKVVHQLQREMGELRGIVSNEELDK